MDTLTKQKRSEVMAKVKGKNTNPEIEVRKLLHGMGYRFRLHNKNLPGKPDICLTKYKTVIFVHGCFWHKHICRSNSKMPKSNAAYWLHKINGNAKRDKKNSRALTRLGWKVITVWECELKNMVSLKNKIKKKMLF